MSKSQVASGAPSFSSFLADCRFEWDLSLMLIMPVMMAVSVARSIDPRVADLVTAAPGEADTGFTCDTKGLGAYKDFPFGISTFAQVLHVLRHLVSYTVLAPARLGDWPTVLVNAQALCLTAFLLLLTVSPRSGRLWAAWRRWRHMAVVCVTLLPRSLLLVPSFLLLPPHTWSTHCWARYVVSASSSPLVNAFLLGLYDQVLKVPLRTTAVVVSCQTAAAFIFAYKIAPTIVTLQLEGSACRIGGSFSNLQPVPLQCGGLRHEHSALLSCRPLAQQVLLGLAMVAWPMWLSWAVEKRLRRQHAAMCAEWQRRRQRQREQWQDTGMHPPGQQHQQQEQLCDQTGQPIYQGYGHILQQQPQQQGTLTAARPFRCIPTDVPLKAPPREESSIPILLDTVRRSTTPLVTGVGPVSPGPAPRRTVLSYAALTTATFLSVKVHDPPGTFEDVKSGLAAAAPQLMARALGGAAGGRAPAAAEPSSVLPPGALLQSAVFRGCVQLVAWARTLREHVCRGQGHGVDGPGHGGLHSDEGVDQQQLQDMVSVLQRSPLPGEEDGQLGSVSAQTWRGLEAGDLPAVHTVLAGRGVGLMEAAERRQPDSGMGPPGGAAVRLLHVGPPALAVYRKAVVGPATDRASGDSAAVLSLLLHSPRPQPARVLVLAEQGGEGGGQQWEPHSPARLLCDLAVELVGGPQEVELALGAGELEGAVGEDGLGVLQLVLVGPEHGTDIMSSEQREKVSSCPLVLCVAPPVLLLPPAAAAEVCGLWAAMQRKAPGGPTAEQQETAETVAAPAGQGLLYPEDIGSGQQVCTWRTHLAPLLGDMAYVLGAEALRQEDVQRVASRLLAYLHGTGLDQVAQLLQLRVSGFSLDPSSLPSVSSDTRDDAALCAAHFETFHGIPTEGYAAADAATTAPGAVGAQANAGAPCKDTCEAPASPPSLSSSSPSARQLHLSAADLWRLLPLPTALFSPPALELAYQASRLARLATAAPFVLLLSALPLLHFTVRTVWLYGYREGLRAALLSALLWASEATPHIAVLRLPAAVRQTAAVGVLAIVPTCHDGTSNGSCDTVTASPVTGTSLSTTGEVAVPAAVRRHNIAAWLYGPAFLLVAGLAIQLRWLPYYVAYVGSVRMVLVCQLYRGVVLPCVQQLSMGQAVAQAGVLGAAEALHMRALQPGWSLAAVVATAATWRATAVGVAAVWERQSRARFHGQVRRGGLMTAVEGCGKAA